MIVLLYETHLEVNAFEFGAVEKELISPVFEAGSQQPEAGRGRNGIAQLNMSR
jgi:hypothetical protein